MTCWIRPSLTLIAGISSKVTFFLPNSFDFTTACGSDQGGVIMLKVGPHEVTTKAETVAATVPITTRRRFRRRTTLSPTNNPHVLSIRVYPPHVHCLASVWNNSTTSASNFLAQRPRNYQKSDPAHSKRSKSSESEGFR